MTHPVWINLIGKAPAWLLLAYNFHSSFQFSPVYWWAFHIFSRNWIINEIWIFIGICIKIIHFFINIFARLSLRNTGGFTHFSLLLWVLSTLHHSVGKAFSIPTKCPGNVKQFLLKLVVNIFRHWVIFSVYFYDYNVRCMLNIGLEQLPKVLLQYICSVIHYLCEQLQ